MTYRISIEFSHGSKCRSAGDQWIKDSAKQIKQGEENTNWQWRPSFKYFEVETHSFAFYSLGLSPKVKYGKQTELVCRFCQMLPWKKEKKNTQQPKIYITMADHFIAVGNFTLVLGRIGRCVLSLLLCCRIATHIHFFL